MIESENGRGEGWDIEWLGGRWEVTLSVVFIVLFGCATPGNMTEGYKLNNIQNVPLKV